MDWFSLGVLALIGVVAVRIARTLSRYPVTKPFNPDDSDDADVLREKHDDMRRGATWENMGL